MVKLKSLRTNPEVNLNEQIMSIFICHPICHFAVRFDAILLDIDHTPDALLNPAHADLYSEKGMRHMRAFIKPGGGVRVVVE